MKIILLSLTAVIAVIYAKTVQTQNNKGQQHSVECIKQSGVNPEVLAAAKRGNFTDDVGLKKFTLCYFQKAGIINRSGRLDVNVALSKVPQTADKAEVKKALELCKTKKGKDAADTAFKVFKCCQKASPANVFL